MNTQASYVIFAPFMTAFGGVERLVVNVSRHLHRRGVRHTVVTFSNSANVAQYADWPIEIIELAGPRNSLLEMLRLRNWLRRHNRRYASNAPVLVFDLKGAFYAASSSVPYVVHLTDPPSLLSEDISKHARSFGATSNSEPKKRARAEVVHRLNSSGVRRAIKVISMTQRIAREIAHLYRVTPVIIRPGIEIPERHQSSSQPAGTLRFLTIGRLVCTKRVEWILQALAELERSRWKGVVAWELVIVGDGPMRDELEATAADLGIADNIRWLGVVSSDGLEQAYAEAAIFLMPAAQGWGLPALEALARRVPVVMHGASGVAEILADSPWVEIADGDSFQSFLECLETMLARGTELRAGGVPLPALPTAEQWAADVFAACNWTSTW